MEQQENWELPMKQQQQNYILLELRGPMAPLF